MVQAMGRVPTRQEWRDERISEISVETIIQPFGTWTHAMAAAGYETAKIRKVKKIDDTIFSRDINAHLDQYVPKEIPKRSAPWPKIAILGDLHEPFSSAKIKADFVLFVAKEQPDYVIQIGDATDSYSHAKFPRSHNQFTPKEEEARARKNLEELWASIGKAAPNAKRVALLGNHDVRPIKRALEVYPAIEHWVEKYMRDLMTFDGVHTVFDPREEYIVSDIAFLHGYRSQLGSHRDYMQMNAVVGHTHRGGAVFRQTQGRILWELNCGFAADANAKGLTYQAQKISDWTLGWGWIDELGPRFIPG